VARGLDFLARLGDFRFGLALAVEKRLNLRAALFGQVRQFGDALFQAAFSGWRRMAQLLLGGQGDLGFGERGVGRVALLAQFSSEASTA
jgi:hypothetical protein